MKKKEEKNEREKEEKEEKNEREKEEKKKENEKTSHPTTDGETNVTTHPVAPANYIMIFKGPKSKIRPPKIFGRGVG